MVRPHSGAAEPVQLHMTHAICVQLFVTCSCFNDELASVMGCCVDSITDQIGSDQLLLLSTLMLTLARGHCQGGPPSCMLIGTTSLFHEAPDKSDSSLKLFQPKDDIVADRLPLTASCWAMTW
jgi:hypothetical protein